MAKTPDVAHDSLITEWDGNVRKYQKDANTQIICQASEGSSVDEAVWRIFQLYDDGTDLSKTWANGKKDFIFIASNWASYTFS